DGAELAHDLAQLLVRSRKLPAAVQDLEPQRIVVRLHLSRRENELRDVGDRVHDIEELAARSAHRRVHRGPEALDGSAAFCGGATDVETLHGHRVRSAGRDDVLEGSAQLRLGGTAGCDRLLRQYIEEASADHALTGRERRPKVGVARFDDGEFRVGPYDQDRTRYLLEEAAVIGIGAFGHRTRGAGRPWRTPHGAEASSLALP